MAENSSSQNLLLDMAKDEIVFICLDNISERLVSRVSKRFFVSSFLVYNTGFCKSIWCWVSEMLYEFGVSEYLL